MDKNKIIFPVLLTVLFACCTTAANAVHDSVTVKHKYWQDSITIASEPDYPPQCFVGEDGKPAGFAIDIFMAAAEAAGLKVDQKIGIWDIIKNDLAEGRIDALPFVGRTPEREDIFDFTIPYLSLHGAVFIRKRTKDIYTLDDLRDKEVVVMKGDNAEEFVRRYNISDNIYTTNTYEEAFRNLARGEYDAVITQRITGIELLDELGIKSVRPLDIHLPRFRQDFCFAVKEGDTELLNRLNEGLSVIIASDIYNEIRIKWFGPEIKEIISARDIISITLYVFIPLLIIFSLATIWFLRMEVKRRTRRLDMEITGHKNTAELLRKRNTLLNEMEKVSKTGGWEYDIESATTTWTEGVYNIFALSGDDFDPSDFSKDLSFYDKKYQKTLENAFKNILETGAPYDLELKLTTSRGEKKWVRTMGMAEVEDGEVKRVFGNIIDITESKRINEELRSITDELEKKVAERTAELREKVEKLDKSQKAMLYMVEDLNNVTADLKEERRKLEASNKELEAFSYSVSHDLRAPLRSINGFARFLLEDYSALLDDEGQRLLKIIMQSARKMDALINDMLNLSRISRAELNKTDVNMNDMVRSMFFEVATKEEEEDFTVVIDEMPHSECDVSLLKQVWQNLIGNALKYSSKSNNKEIRIWAETTDGYIWYFVKDHGAGFDMKYRDKLFGVFQRLHKETEFEGTGVGLAIVQRIISKHGGRVDATGEPEKGATFSFSLPVR